MSKFSYYGLLTIALSITAHLWYDSHSTNISVCGVWGTRVKVQVSKRKLQTHIH